MFVSARSLQLVAARRRFPAFELHSQRQVHLGQDFFDLFERLPTKILGLQHLRLTPLHQFTDVANVGVLQTVRRANRELELLNRLVEVLVQLALLLRDRLIERFVGFLKIDKDGQLILEDLRGIANRILRLHRAIRPHFYGELVIVGLLTDTSVGDDVVHLLDR